MELFLFCLYIDEKSKDWPPRKTLLAVVAPNNSNKCKFYHCDHPIYCCFLFRKKPECFDTNLLQKTDYVFYVLKLIMWET